MASNFTFHCYISNLIYSHIIFVHTGYFCLGLYLVKSSFAYNTFGQYLVFTVFGEIYVIPSPLTTNVNGSNSVTKAERQLSACMCREQYKTIVDTVRTTEISIGRAVVFYRVSKINWDGEKLFWQTQSWPEWTFLHLHIPLMTFNKTHLSFYEFSLSFLGQ